MGVVNVRVGDVIDLSLPASEETITRDLKKSNENLAVSGRVIIVLSHNSNASSSNGSVAAPAQGTSSSARASNPAPVASNSAAAAANAAATNNGGELFTKPVSYTHLTLPTILRV